jgi:hypothetical protein
MLRRWPFASNTPLLALPRGEVAVMVREVRWYVLVLSRPLTFNFD